MTTQYRDAVALRRALEDRLKKEAHNSGTDLARRRRIVVFDRIAARLADDSGPGWILKGGAIMEFRLRERARTTRDLDLSGPPTGSDGSAVRDLIIEALTADSDRDHFRFAVSYPVNLTVDSTGRGGWRFSVEAQLAGKQFAKIKVDVVARSAEIAKTEQLPLPNTLEFAGTPQRSIEAVDRSQHFAEKLHALTREYGDRPNTRVKDLADLVLIIESGLTPDDTVWTTTRHVFESRATHAIPEHIPDPPPGWDETYTELAKGLTETDIELAPAMQLLREFWTQVRRASENTTDEKD